MWPTCCFHGRYRAAGKFPSGRRSAQAVGGSSGSSRMKFLSGALVIGELALAVVLLSGAGLMIRSFLNMYTMDLGVRKDHLLVMRYGLAEAKYATPEARLRFHERLLAGLQSTP